jgi:MFS family permease
VPRVIKKIGYKPILVVAPLIVASGLFWLSKIPVDGTFWGNVAPGLILLGFGMGATFVSVTIAATSGVKGEESGVASGLLNTSQQVGGAIGLAVLTGIATSAAAAYLKDLGLHAAPAKEQIAAATVHGFQRGYLIAAGFAIFASILAALVIKPQKGDKTELSPADMAGA